MQHAKEVQNVRRCDRVRSDESGENDPRRPRLSNTRDRRRRSREGSRFSLRNMPRRVEASKQGDRRASGRSVLSNRRDARSADAPKTKSAQADPFILIGQLRARVVALSLAVKGVDRAKLSTSWLKNNIGLAPGETVEDAVAGMKAAGSTMRLTVNKSALKVELVKAAPVADIRRVFETWKRTMGKTDRAILDRKRRRKIEDRLREGYPVERLEAAIAGAMLCPYLRGGNDSGKVYDDLVTVLRDGVQVERLEALTVEAKKPKSVFDRRNR